MVRIGTYVITRTRAGTFQWNLKASSGEVILSSQTYKSKASAQKGIASAIRHTASGDFFERRMARNKLPFFVIKARNGMVVGKSQKYETERLRDNAMKSVAKHGPTSATKDLSAKR